MVNDVLPDAISLALGRNTKNQILTQADMDVLEQKNIAKRWAGVRAVVFDGFPNKMNSLTPYYAPVSLIC